MSFQRLPVPLPTGWRVVYHELYAVDPTALAPDSEGWAYLCEDLLQVRDEGELLLDVGWYPDGRPEGAYRLVVIRGVAWDVPSHRWRGRSLAALREELRERLADLANRFPSDPTTQLVAELGAVQPERRARAAERLAWRGTTEALEAIQQACATERNRDIQLRICDAMRALVRRQRGAGA